MRAVLSVVLLALPALAGPKIGVLDVSGVGIEAGKVTLFAEHLATRLVEAGAEVTTPRTLSTVLGLEKQKLLLGCANVEGSADCMVELGGALGVEFLVMGQLAQVGNSFPVSLKLLSAKTGAVVQTFSERAATEEGVFALLDRAALKLVGKVQPRADLSGLRRSAWIPAAVGAVLGGVGAGLLVSSRADHASLVGPAVLAPGAGESARDAGRLKQSLGVGLLAAGGAALVTAAVLFVVGTVSSGEPPVQVAAAPVAGGMTVSLGGSF